ncbi:phosphate uptake regulator PhoU [Candidatus Bathyarchaeota archaeon]|nr:MAG: phosphate uptake regulator PhoU [Candidatus Bathyarchaeota archaeon]
MKIIYIQIDEDIIYIVRYMEKDLGYRKIQITGRGSYIISLPKKWIKELKLERGEEIAFKARGDSTLLLLPRKILEGRKETKQPSLKEYRIFARSHDDPQSICRKIISLYVVSANIIRIRFLNGEIPPEHKTAINNLIKNMLLGSEIIDETANEITIQVLVDHPEFPVEKAIRRMAILALSANKDAVLALREFDENRINSVVETCNDVNRLNLYVIRQLKYGLEKDLFRELGFKTRKEFLGYRIVANDIRSIAINAMNLVNNILTLKKMIRDQMLFLKTSVDEEVYSQILKFNSQVHLFFEESLKALFKRDYDRADKLLSEIESFAALESDLITLISTKKMDPNVSSILRLIIDNSRRIIEYSRDIAEVTMNRTVEEIIEQLQTSRL